MGEKFIIKGKISKVYMLMLILTIFNAIFSLITFIYLEKYIVYDRFLKMSVFSSSEFPNFLITSDVCITTAILICFMMNQYEIVVTDKKVFGKNIFGKSIDLPINQISYLGLGLYNTITVATSSVKIRFLPLKNRQEVYLTISKLLYQNQNSNNTVIQKEVNSINADELKNFKNLLDMGAITQEEFDKKKKELLNL